MPYEIRMQGDKHCVFNKDTGDNKGCSDSHEMAVKHMRALYANAGGKALEGWLDPPEVIQKALDYFQEVGAEIITDVTTEIDTETTVKTTHVDGEYATVETDESTRRSINHYIVERLGVKEKSWWGNIISRFSGERPSSVMAFKDSDGRVRVIMRVSNMFKDRHGEIITSEAHKEYVDWVDADAGNRMPEFWLWHTKGTKWGRADVLDFTDGFLITSGLADVGYEDVAVKLAEHNDIGVSHGFYGASIQGKGFIDFYRSFEFSPLPRKEAANVWTAMMLAKEAELPISDAKRKFFIEELGMKEEYIQKIEADNKDESAAIKAMGIAWKEDADAGPNASNGDAGAASNVSTEPSQPTLADVMARLDSLAGEINGIKEKATGEASSDAVAQALEAAMASGKGFVPSQAKDNAASPGDAAAQKSNWFSETVIEPAFGTRG